MGKSADSNNKKNPPARFACGVPHDQCSGAPTTLNAGLRIHKTHASAEEAFRCYKRSLLKAGWTPVENNGVVDQRALLAPDKSTVMVLSKPSKFGARLRAGKQGTRHRPVKQHGVII